LEQENNTLNSLHEEFIQDFSNIQSAYRDERKQCLEDRRFYSIAGAQWEGDLEAQFENKPKLEVNKIHLSIMRIFSEYRNNRITVDFLPKDGNDKMADTCDSLYRADEQDSQAEEAYDNAFEEAVGGGIGAWRLIADYEDEEDDENDYQRIKIEPIFDADSSVFFDLNAKRQDKSDAKRCYVITSMTHNAFEKEWDKTPSSIQKQVDDTEFDWATDEVIYVAEVYQVEYVKHTVKIFKLNDEEKRYTQEEIEENPAIESEIIALGFVLEKEKKVKKRKIRKYFMSGSEILEDCGYVAGKHIPIVSTYGKRWVIDNVERCMGHVRLAKDSQRLKNMQLSKLAELSAISSTEKPILTTEQVAGLENIWAEDNIKNYPYLPINPAHDQNGNPIQTSPVGYTKPPMIPPAMAALLQLTEGDLRDVLGNQEGGEKIVSNISGEAVDKIQDRLDMQTFIYVSNMAKAIKRSGEVWLSMSKELYIEDGREMKSVNSDKKISTLQINQPYMTEEGEEVFKNDMAKANMGVTVDVGASTSSKRKSTLKAIKDMMMASGDQETINILSSLAMMNMEGEGISDAREFFRSKLVSMGVFKTTEEEAQQMAQAATEQQPSVEEIYLQSEAEKSRAQADKAQADTALSLAKADETVAKTAEKLASLEREDREQIMAIFERMQQPVESATSTETQPRQIETGE